MNNLRLLKMRNVLHTTFKKSSPSFSSISTGKSSPSTASAASTAADFVGDDDLDDVSVMNVRTVKPAMLPSLLQPRVVVFDGVCPLCHSGVKWVIKADKYRKIKFCCLQSETAEPYMKLCGVDREDVLRRFIFVEGLGQYHQASTAALKVASYLPLPYSALSSLMVIPTPMRDVVYDYIAKRRYNWFGKKKECLVLHEPEMLERFIDREELLERQRHQSDI
ncbi:uncharacterized protein LOC141644245 [Silene latifolia]|uniref:uncharacterized protein LOC141644245 n=1 Tax=Silene latifolia TaxID=37657 RepID=UPI003D78923E